MFNFSANHLFLISRVEYPSCAVFVMLDRDTQRVYRLFDFTKRRRLTPDQPYHVAGKVNSVHTLYLRDRVGQARYQARAALHSSCSC
jgi:hypothetical protein